MKFKLSIPVYTDFSQIRAAKEVLAANAGSEIIHDRMISRGFFMGKNWAIDLCKNHWELRIHKRYVSKPWFTEFLLKWT